MQKAWTGKPNSLSVHVFSYAISKLRIRKKQENTQKNAFVKRHNMNLTQSFTTSGVINKTTKPAL